MRAILLLTLLTMLSPGAGRPWSFEPIRRPSPPKVMDEAWSRTLIDRFILTRLEGEKVKPSPEASKRTLLRRLSLDLTGLLPTPEEMQAFLADQRPDAYEQQVDRLLASPHYGEKWARHWLDLARYADSDGYEKDWTRPWAWRYRNWVIDALNRNMPFDEFSIQQLAGDLLPNAGVEHRVATGFHRMTLTNREGGVDNEQFRFEAALDRASTTGSVWLGLTVGCAQCHDHKYDPVSQKDFYRWSALFDNLEEVDIDAPVPGEPGSWFRGEAEYRTKRNALLADYNVPALQAAWERNMLEAAANPGKRTDWDLAWDCLLKLTVGGDGEKIIRKDAATRSQRDNDVLVDHFVRNYHFAIGNKKFQELKFPELDKKLTALRVEYPRLTQAYAVMESPKVRESHVRVRGDYKSLGILVEPGVLSTLPSLEKNGRVSRLDMARWLFRPENPLTARVTVNRIWQELFGAGLVRTSDDFGMQGDKPSHPELLDWLASEFRDSGWDVKHLQRLIMTSAVYRQSSDTRSDLQAKDPGNTLLARQSRLRLPAEMIRDAAFLASGLLNPAIGGPSVKPPQPPGVAELAYGNSVKWVESQGPDRYRRGLYIFFQRTTPYPLLANFDASKASAAACRRLRSNTPLQALNLLNDPAFFEAAQALATRVLAESGKENQQRLKRVYGHTLNRDPLPEEIARLEKFLATQKTILDREPGAAERIYPGTPPGGDRLEAAAWTSLSSILLNLDEFFTRE